MKKTRAGIMIFVLACMAFSPLSAKPEREITKEEKILVYTYVLQALGQIGDIRASDTLIRALKSKEYIVRYYAVSALSALKDKDSVGPLKALVEDPDFNVRILTAKTLLDLGQPEAEDILLGFLNDNDPAVRSSAITQIGALGEKHLSRLYEVLLKDDNYVVRSTIIPILGSNKFEPAKEFIIKATEDENVTIRQAACSILGYLDDSEGLPLLLKMLNDVDVTVRATAKEVLSAKGEQSIIKACWEDIEKDDPLLRKSSFIALANLKDINILPVLLRDIVAADSQLLIRQTAAQSLIILKPHVEELMSKGLPGIKPEMVSSGSLGISYKSAGKELGLVFAEALKDKNNPLHKDSSFVIVDLQERQALPVLREALLDDEPEMVAAAAYCLGAFQDKDSVANLIKVSKKYGL